MKIAQIEIPPKVKEKEEIKFPILMGSKTRQGFIILFINPTFGIIIQNCKDTSWTPGSMTGSYHMSSDYTLDDWIPLPKGTKVTFEQE